MMNLVFVALGGALGSAARYGVGVAAARWFGADFPWGTLMVNVAGGLAMGLLAARTEQADAARLLLGVGFLGGFTTFSAFSLETVRLMQQRPELGLAYIAASLALSVGACWLGLMLGRP